MNFLIDSLLSKEESKLLGLWEKESLIFEEFEFDLFEN